MRRTSLISWIGLTELESSSMIPEAGGPIALAVSTFNFDQIYLLSSFEHAPSVKFSKYLQKFTSLTPEITEFTLSSPMNFEEIYRATITTCMIAEADCPGSSLVYHISSGTSVMAAVFILIARTLFPGKIIQTSKEHGAKEIGIPFDISIDFIPKLLEKSDNRLSASAGAPTPHEAAFSTILYRSPQMHSAVLMAKKAAVRSIPILLEGESGTGKELFAKAIHQASPRRAKPFSVINCGAIPHNLAESELFGYVKGAFTGAYKTKSGVFEAARGGTVFLDEISELPLAQQVALLRTIQEKTIRKIGSIEETDVDFRIIAASNKDLIKEVQSGRFREDLFYRLAIAVIKLPPLRERQGDISFLVKHIMQSINRENSDVLSVEERTLSPAALQLLYNYPWPGNVRELINTLQRAVLWAETETISKEHLASTILSLDAHWVGNNEPGLKMQTHTFLLREEINNQVQSWISLALELSKGNKTEAARMLGLNNYQTLTNWMKRINLS
jgi:transcriptional regulator with PAS, ATPase and Fis domain